jgi:beta-lactamase class A
MAAVHPLLASALAALLLLAACADEPVAPPGPAPIGSAGAERAPAGLNERLQSLGEGFYGRVGIAVEDIGNGWTASFDGGSLYPQQSVSKLCTAIALLDQVDKGALSLADPVMVRREDMSVFHQPIQAKLTDAGYLTTLDELLQGAIAQSDNASDDILIARLGGPAVVQSAVTVRGLGAIRCGPPVHLLEAKIAGLQWRPEYSFGQAFWTARDTVPTATRAALLSAYLANPDDGASPLAVVHLLARLQRGELLSGGSTARLLQALAATRTGPQRLPAGLGPGWSIAHKTGTGQDLGAQSTGYNDVGLLTAPDGRAYAVAVMIASTQAQIPQRQALMAAVAQAVVAAHDASPGR